MLGLDHPASRMANHKAGAGLPMPRPGLDILFSGPVASHDRLSPSPLSVTWEEQGQAKGLTWPVVSFTQVEQLQPETWDPKPKQGPGGRWGGGITAVALCKQRAGFAQAPSESATTPGGAE